MQYGNVAHKLSQRSEINRPGISLPACHNNDFISCQPTALLLLGLPVTLHPSSHISGSCVSSALSVGYR